MVSLLRLFTIQCGILGETRSANEKNSAGAWSSWETHTSKLIIDPGFAAKAEDPKWYIPFSSPSSLPIIQLTFYHPGH
jgi:hypothetical protein